MADTNKILLIDDKGSTNKHLYDMLSNKPYEIVTTEDPTEALKMLYKSPEEYGLILLANEVNNLSDYELLHLLKRCSRTKLVPVVARSSGTCDDYVNSCIKAGIRYCLPHHLDNDVFLSLLEAAIRDKNRYFQDESGKYNSEHIFDTIKQVHFNFQRLDEAQSIANFFARICPNPNIAVIGIAELLINAIEHGNLNISYDEKSQLHQEGRWLEEVAHRLEKPEFKDKFVEASLYVKEGMITMNIKDQGKGFDWQKFEQIDATRIHDNHGRGIVMAKTLTFEELTYKGCGNEVECVISTGK